MTTTVIKVGEGLDERMRSRVRARRPRQRFQLLAAVGHFRKVRVRTSYLGRRDPTKGKHYTRLRWGDFISSSFSLLSSRSQARGISQMDLA